MESDAVDRLLAGIAKIDGAEMGASSDSEVISLRAEGRTLIVEAIREIVVRE